MAATWEVRENPERYDFFPTINFLGSIFFLKVFYIRLFFWSFPLLELRYARLCIADFFYVWNCHFSFTFDLLCLKRTLDCSMPRHVFDVWLNSMSQWALKKISFRSSGSKFDLRLKGYGCCIISPSTPNWATFGI